LNLNFVNISVYAIQSNGRPALFWERRVMQ
jgi:hypothetical protein